MTPRVRKERRTTLLAVLAFGACGGSLANRGSVEATIGRATRHDLVTQAPEVLQRYGYAIYATRETSNTVYIETNWRGRAPFDDEAEAGSDFARTRFVVRARLGGAGFYTVRITAENQIRLKGGQEAMSPTDTGTAWTTIPATPMYDDYVSDIMLEIELNVDAGLRTRGTLIRLPANAG